jgi:SagB-type dehydrogenase family enzyme
MPPAGGKGPGEVRCKRRGLTAKAFFLAVLVAAAGVGMVAAQTVGSLPRAVTHGRITLEEAFAQRRSVREFGDAALSDSLIAQLLWAAQGVSGSSGLRTSPSAGALYPLELYLVTARGVFHYEPLPHALARWRSGDRRDRLQQVSLGQEAVGGAPAVFVFAAVYARTEVKYGAARGRRYVYLEAGHAAQNLLLEAAALGLAAVPIGAFDDKPVQGVLELPGDQEPIYLVPVGHPRR